MMDVLLKFIVLISVIELTRASILDFYNRPYRQNHQYQGVNFHSGYDYPKPHGSRFDFQNHGQQHSNYGHYDLNYQPSYHRHMTQYYGHQGFNNGPQYGKRRDTNENINYPRQSWNEYDNYDYQDYFSGPPGGERFWTFPGQTPPWQQTPSPSAPDFPPPQRPPSPPVNTAATITACIRNCPVTSEYNPVCGTNNVTYTNTGRLNCAKFCGVDVEIKCNSPCAQPMPVPTSPSSPPPPTLVTGNVPVNPIPLIIPTQPTAPEVTTEIDFQIDIRHPDE